MQMREYAVHADYDADAVEMGQPASVFNFECPNYHLWSSLLVLSILINKKKKFIFDGHRCGNMRELMHIGKYAHMAIPNPNSITPTTVNVIN